MKLKSLEGNIIQTDTNQASCKITRLRFHSFTPDKLPWKFPVYLSLALCACVCKPNYPGVSENTKSCTLISDLGGIQDVAGQGRGADYSVTLVCSPESTWNIWLYK